MKTLGILGGVGPETTSKVYHSVINSMRESGQTHYPSILIYNLPWPHALEDDMIIHGRNSEKMIPYLLKGARMLERAGASFGILPCNTLHKHIDDIRASVAIPFLSIIEETQRQLEVLAVRSVGILATQTTISSCLYGTPLQEKGLDLIHPNAAQQKRIGRVIIELVRGESRKIHGELISNIFTSLPHN